MNVADATALVGHEKLEVLDLEANRVSDLDELSSLGTCCALWSLTLAGNPVARRADYRRVCAARIGTRSQYVSWWPSAMQLALHTLRRRPHILW